jgi:rhodanese-related sulfurtransferase
MIASGEPYMIYDARPYNKFLKGSIPSSVGLPQSKFEQYRGLLPSRLDTPIVTYCGGFKCKLSHKLTDQIQALGYTNVVIDESGYPGWKEKFGTGGEVAIETGDMEGAMDVAQFEKLMKENPESIMLIDVRDPDEFAAGHLPTAKNVPVEQVAEDIKDFESDKPVVFVCSTGARSGECYYMFLDQRPDMEDVYYIEATIEYDKDGGYKIVPNE